MSPRVFPWGGGAPTSMLELSMYSPLREALLGSVVLAAFVPQSTVRAKDGTANFIRRRGGRVLRSRPVTWLKGFGMWSSPLGLEQPPQREVVRSAATSAATCPWVHMLSQRDHWTRCPRLPSSYGNIFRSHLLTF